MQKQYRGAVFFDVDGTLVDERFEIYQPTDKTKEAIEKLKENGYLVGIATGRARCYIPQTGIDFDCYISSNGAVAEVDGREIFNDTISEEMLEELICYMESEKMYYILEGAQGCYVQEEAQEKMYEIYQTFQIPILDCFSVLDTFRGKKVNKLLVSFDRISQYEAMQEKFKDRLSVMRIHRHLLADVGKAHMSKAVGVRAVIETLRLDMKDTYAFGDDYNDIEMLQTVGCGVAMTPHAEGLEKAAKYQTGSVKEEGIAHALSHLGLI